MTSTQNVTNTSQPPKGDSLLANLALNIIIPSLILFKASGEELLGIKGAVIVALAFPLLYGAHDLLKSHKINWFSALGVISVGLTGGIMLLELDTHYIAIKEALIPGILGAAVLVSLKTPYPLIRTLIYNPRILQVDKVADALEKSGNKTAFERSLVIASYLLASSFLLSSALNYILAKILLVSPPGSVELNQELAKMQALSFPVIAVPSTIVMMIALFYLFRKITRLTHLSLEEILHH